LPLNANVNVSDTSIGAVNDSTRWFWYNLNGTVAEVDWGKDANYLYGGVAGVYKASKRVKSANGQQDTMVYYLAIGLGGGTGLGEQIVKLAPSTFINSEGEYSHSIGFNTEYFTDNDTARVWYILRTSGSYNPKALNWNDVVVFNGIRYLRVAIQVPDSTLHLAYGWGDTTGPIGTWKFANITTSEWFEPSVQMAEIMTKSGQWYKHGMITYTVLGNAGDNNAARRVFRWESVLIGNQTYYNFYFNSRCVPTHNGTNPYVRYRLNGNSAWIQQNATYIGSTGFMSIQLPRTDFIGTGQGDFEFYAGNIEANYTGSDYNYQFLNQYLQGFWP